METFKNVMMRIGAVLAGALGAARVLEALARFFLNDGSLTADEINAAFAKVDKKASAE